MFKAFLVIFSYVTSYEFKNLVEVASIELKTQVNVFIQFIRKNIFH